MATGDPVWELGSSPHDGMLYIDTFTPATTGIHGRATSVTYTDTSGRITSYPVPASTPLTVTFPPTPAVEKEVAETKALPLCGICNKNVSKGVSYAENDMFTMVFECHNDRRRIDVPLSKFKGNEEDAREYILQSIDYLFVEKNQWIELEPVRATHVNAGKQAIKKWLS